MCVGVSEWRCWSCELENGRLKFLSRTRTCNSNSYFTFTSDLHLNAAIGKISQLVSALIFLRGGCLGDFFAGF